MEHAIMENIMQQVMASLGFVYLISTHQAVKPPSTNEEIMGDVYGAPKRS
jgi:hypothetical protein